MANARRCSSCRGTDRILRLSVDVRHRAQRGYSGVFHLCEGCLLGIESEYAIQPATRDVIAATLRALKHLRGVA